MSKQTEALKLALELLDKQWQCTQVWSLEEAQDVADNIREALAEQPAQQQEPVAWMYPSDYEKCLTSEHVAEVTSIECTSLRTGEKTTVPLYTSPPASKPLTDEEISNLWCEVSNTDFVTADTHEFARAIEAAHGIKGDA